MSQGKSATQNAKQAVNNCHSSSALLRTFCSDRLTSPGDLSIVCSYRFPHTRHYVLAGLASHLCFCPRLLRRLGDDVKASQKRGAVLFVALGPAPGYIHDGGTPERHSMLLRHTSTQLL